MNDLPKEKLREIKKEIEDFPQRIINVQELGEKYNIGIRELCNSFKYVYKITVKQYANLIKLKYLTTLVLIDKADNGKKVYDYARELGFSDDTGLHHFVKRNTGNKTFLEFRRIVQKYCIEFCQAKCLEGCQEKIQ